MTAIRTWSTIRPVPTPIYYHDEWIFEYAGIHVMVGNITRYENGHVFSNMRVTR